MCVRVCVCKWLYVCVCVCVWFYVCWMNTVDVLWYLWRLACGYFCLTLLFFHLIWHDCMNNRAFDQKENNVPTMLFCKMFPFCVTKWTNFRFLSVMSVYPFQLRVFIFWSEIKFHQKLKEKDICTKSISLASNMI